MSCPSCGKNIPIAVAFCRYCGINISTHEKLLQERHSEALQAHSVAQPRYAPVKINVSKESMASKFLSGWVKVPGIVRLVILFIVLNVGLWGAQELYYWDDSQRMQVLDIEIKDMDKQIKYMEKSPSSTTQSQYESLISKRNKEADEYNTLVESSSSRLYLIPIPMGHHTTH